MQIWMALMPDIQDFTILEVKGVNDWTGSYGPMKEYSLMVQKADGSTGVVSLNQKPTTAPPNPGDVIRGHTETNNHGTKLKKEKKEGYSDSGGGGSSNDTEIRRAVAFKGAIEAAGEMDDEHKFVDTVRRLTDAFDDILAGKVESDVKAKDPHPAETSQDPDDQIPF